MDIINCINGEYQIKMNKRKNDNDDNDLPCKKQLQEYCDANFQQENDKHLAYSILIFIAKEIKQKDNTSDVNINEKLRLKFPQASIDDFKIARNIIDKAIQMKLNK